MSGAKMMRMVLLDKEISHAAFARKINKPVQTWYNILQRDAMSVKALEEFANEVGCDVVLVDRQTKKMYY